VAAALAQGGLVGRQFVDGGLRRTIRDD